MKILPFFSCQLLDEFLSFIERHCIHFGFDQFYSASFGLASFIECVFFWVKVDKVSFGSSSSFSLAFQAVLGEVT
jgi:hypothetical protein